MNPIKTPRLYHPPPFFFFNLIACYQQNALVGGTETSPIFLVSKSFILGTQIPSRTQFWKGYQISKSNVDSFLVLTALKHTASDCDFFNKSYPEETLVKKK